MRTTAPLLDRRTALGTLAFGTLAATLSDPRLARAAAASLEPVSLVTGDGRTVQAALARPKAKKAPAVLVIHEFWGLNDQIKAFSKDLADRGYLALAVDLIGRPPTDDREIAMKNMQAVKTDEATTTVKAWIPWLAANAQGTGKVATMGFCFGGAWSLNASLATPVDGTIIYYGRCDKTAAELGALKGPVLGHFSTRDTYITRAMVEGFAKAMAEAGKAVTVHWYDGEHGFANPTTARYNEADAGLALSRSLDFLKRTIG